MADGQIPGKTGPDRARLTDPADGAVADATSTSAGRGPAACHDPPVSMAYGVLGRLEVRRAGRPLAPLPPQQRLLLCLLLVRSNAVVPDDTLFQALWGQTPDGRRQRLFELVSRLRDALGASADGGPLLRSSGGYRLEVGGSELDADRFERARAEGVRLVPTGPLRAVERLQAAEALWRGRPYHDVDDAPEFDDEIRRLHELRMSCREIRLEALLAAGRPQEVLDEVTPLAAVDVVRERTQHVHLLALVRCGRRAEACRHYDWLWQRLRAERLEPGPELKALYDRIVADDPALLTAAPGPVSVRDLPPAVHVALDGPWFVGADGRAGALERIEAEGHPVVVVRGEPGAGKSRLVAELARRAHRRGATVLWGRASASAAVPFQAFLDGLAPLVGAEPGVGAVGDPGGPGASNGPDDDPGTILARLRAGAGGSASRAPGGQDLFAAVHERLRLAAAANEVVLVVDDVHWLSDDERALWHHLLRTIPPGLTLVATARRPPDGEDPGWLRDLRAAGRVTVVDLPALGPAAVAELARRMGRTLPPGRAEALATRTNGNAFFLVTLLRAGPDGPDGPGALGGDVVASVLAAFHRLPADARRLVEAASLAGPACTVDAVAGAAGIADPDVTVAVAVEAGILRRVGPGAVEFCHDIFREAVGEHLDGDRRRQLHHRLGRLGESGGRQALGDAAALADHFRQAAGDDLARLLRYSVLAALDAERASAPADAARHYRRAVDAAALAEPDHRLLRCRLLVQLGESQRAAYLLAEARPSLVEAATLALALDARPELDGALTGLAWAHDLPDAEPEVRELAERALALPGLPPGRRARYLAARVRLGGQPADDVRRHLDEAEELARRTPDEVALGLVLAVAAFMLAGPESLAWRREAAEEIRSIGARTGYAELAVQSHRLLAAVLLEAGDRPRAEAAFRLFVDRAAGSGRPAFDAAVAQIENSLDLLRGDFAAVEARLPRVLGGVSEGPGYVAAYLVQLAWMRRDQGRGRETLPGLRGTMEEVSGLRVTMAATALEAGDREAGDAALDRVVAAGLDAVPRDSSWLAAMADLAIAAWLGDRPDLAADVYERLAPYADQVVVLGYGILCLGSAQRFAGVAAVAAGRYDAGVAHLRAGLGVDQGLDAGPAVARGHLALGRTLSPGTPGPVEAAEARRSLGEARRWAERLGMAGVVADADRELLRR
jgi:DNA-binding SARP family transcriptional activator